MLALLVAAVTVFHARGLRPGYAFLPIDNVRNNLPWRSGAFVLGELQNPIIGDPIYQFYPFLADQVASLKAGHWPLWLPRILLGHPLAGDPLAQTFYPVFMAVGLAFGAARGLTLGVWLHALAAATFTYAWLRACRLGPAGAVAGALTYALSGYLITFFETPFWVSTLAWLPGVLWMLERADRRRSLASAAVGGVMLGLAGLAGQVSFVAAFGIFLGLYALGQTIRRSRQAGRRVGRPLINLGIAAVIGGLVASAQLLPAIEALAQSHRNAGRLDLALPWPQAITFLVPSFFGNPTTTHVYWGALNFGEGTFYMGLAAMFLAGLAVLVSRQFWPRYVFGLGLAVAYFAFGGPGAGWLAQLPLMRYIAQWRTVFLVSLVIAYLAGWALGRRTISAQAIVGVAAAFGVVMIAAWFGNVGGAQTHAAELRGPLAWAGGLLAAITLLLLARRAWPRQRARLTWLIVALVYVDLAVFGSRFNPALPIADLPAATPAITLLQEQAGAYRVATRQPVGDIVFGPNYLSVFGLSDLGGYSSLLPRTLAELVKAGDPGSGGYNANTIWLNAPSPRLLDILQAGYVVSKEPRPDPGIRVEHQGGCDGQTAEIASSQPVTGEFRVAQTAINRLDLTVRVAAGAMPAGAVTVRMWQGAGRARLALEGQAELDSVTDLQTLVFFFAPEKDAPGQLYEWEVSTEADHTDVALCAEADGQPSYSTFGSNWQPVYDGKIHISERLGRLPRAYVVYAAEVMPDEGTAIERVLDETFDIRSAAIVGEAVGLPATSALTSTPAEILRTTDTEVDLRVTAEREGMLLLGDQAYPGWRAWVDGREAPVVTANVVWRGVVVSPGEHRVEFRFAPRSVTMGLGLTAIGLLLAAGVWVNDRRCG